MHKAQTAILLFSRSLEAEFQAKSFGLTKDRFRLLYNALSERTRKTLGGVEAPVFEFNSHQQVGNVFGERLVNALKEVQNKGYQRVIVIGNDAPGLNPAILNAAIERVDHGKNVLGRDAHGGCYLMGFDISQVELRNFHQIQWHTSRVFDQVNDLLLADTSLPLLIDLNTKEDLKTALLLKSSPYGYIIALIKLVFILFLRATPSRLNTRKISLSTTLYRGPPAFAAIPLY
ncbi:MAG: hypothetical protein Roseis2KO_57900 [Roseivirga sp.]